MLKQKENYKWWDNERSIREWVDKVISQSIIDRLSRSLRIWLLAVWVWLVPPMAFSEWNIGNDRDRAPITFPLKAETRLSDKFASISPPVSKPKKKDVNSNNVLGNTDRYIVKMFWWPQDDELALMRKHLHWLPQIDEWNMRVLIEYFGSIGDLKIFLSSIWAVESEANPEAVSPKWVTWLMWITTDTARHYLGLEWDNAEIKEELKKPEVSIKVAMLKIADIIERSKRFWEKPSKRDLLFAYNTWESYLFMVYTIYNAIIEWTKNISFIRWNGDKDEFNWVQSFKKKMNKAKPWITASLNDDLFYSIAYHFLLKWKKINEAMSHYAKVTILNLKQNSNNAWNWNEVRDLFELVRKVEWPRNMKASLTVSKSG